MGSNISQDALQAAQLLRAQSTNNLLPGNIKPEALYAAQRIKPPERYEHQAVTSPYDQFKSEYPGLGAYTDKVTSGGYLKENIDKLKSIDATEEGMNTLLDYANIGGITKKVGSKISDEGADMWKKLTHNTLSPAQRKTRYNYIEQERRRVAAAGVNVMTDAKHILRGKPGELKALQEQYTAWANKLDNAIGEQTELYFKKDKYDIDEIYGRKESMMNWLGENVTEFEPTTNPQTLKSLTSPHKSSDATDMWKKLSHKGLLKGGKKVTQM